VGRADRVPDILSGKLVEGRMAQKKANPAVRFMVAFLIVVAIALVAFFVGYLIGMRLAVLPLVVGIL
jgi:hypothetical protein